MNYIILNKVSLLFFKNKLLKFVLLFIFINAIGLAQNSKFIGNYDDTPDKDYKVLSDTLKYYLFLERTVNDLNGIFNLNEDINIVFTQGNEINAFYDDNSKMIVVTYELLEYLFNSFQNSFSVREDLVNAVSNMTKLIIFHEVTHCLIDLYQLSVERWDDDEPTDELMTILLLNIDNNYHLKQQLLEALKQFYYISSLVTTNLENLPYWDEHNMSRKRFYQIICWIYGSDSLKYSFLFELGILPQELAGKCSNEFTEINNKWNNISQIILKK